MREERLAREKTDRRPAAPRKRLQYVGGGVMALAALAAIAIALVTLLGGESADGPKQARSQAGLPKLPEPLITEDKERRSRGLRADQRGAGGLKP